MTTTTPVDADTGEILVRPFAAFLQDRAASHQELSDRLHELIAAVIDTGKAGVLTRIQDGALLLGYVIDRPEDVLRMAVSEVVDEIRDGWDGPLFVGRPQ